MRLEHHGVEARLFRRGKTYHASWTSAGRRHRKSTGCTEQRAAERRVRELIERTSGGRGAVDSVRLSEALRIMVAERWQHQASARTRVPYVEEAIEFMGDPDISDISRTMVIRWRQSLLKSGLNPATANRKVSALLVVLNTAAHTWEMPVHPPKIAKLEERKCRYHSLTDREVSELLATARPPYDRVFQFLIETGVRRGELLKLTWKDVDLEDGRVWVESKGGEYRGVPLTDDMRRHLTEIKHEAGRDDRVWELTIMSLRWEWNRCKREMNQEDNPDFVLHSLRHTCATRMVNQGVPTRVAQKWLGHSSVTTTQKYLNPQNRDLDQWVKYAAVPVDRGTEDQRECPA